MIRQFTALITGVIAVLSCWSADPSLTSKQYASNYYAYPYPEQELPKLTPAPKGYEPFHIEHYGRHGSRWHIGEWIYTSPIYRLHKAERVGKLTPRGEQLIAQLRAIEMESRGRDGELTPLGAQQHRGIAQRMYGNFPEVFKGDARIDARSTNVVRCILSMDNELQEFKALNPKLNISSDASVSTLPYMNYRDTVAQNRYEQAKPALAAVKKTMNIDYKAFARQLISDPKFIDDSIDVKGLFDDIFRIAANAQSHYDQEAPLDLFTDEEIHDKWKYENARWFLRFGNTDLTQGTGPLRQRYLLRNWIDSADKAIMAKTPGANLRFGHEVVLLPLAVLMELDGFGAKINDLTTVEAQWKNYEVFPMASNIQMVFYRPKKGTYAPTDVLVKVLLNENEVSLPCEPIKEGSVYYRWEDVKNYYFKKLGKDFGVFPPKTPYLL